MVVFILVILYQEKIGKFGILDEDANRNLAADALQVVIFT